MWLSFALCCVTCIFVLYLPGYFLFRGLSFNPAHSLLFAPIASVAFIGLFPILINFAGLRCNSLMVLAPTIAVCLLVFLVSKASHKVNSPFSNIPQEWKLIALYGAAGLAVCTYIFVKSLDGADSFYCRFDNLTHLNMVRYFIDSGQWSSLSASTGSIAAVGNGAHFYPSAWHDLAALVSVTTSSDPIVAINALNAVICGIVYPLSMCALILALFPKDKTTRIVAGIACMSVACFPWAFLIKGPLVSNLLSYSFLPAVLALLLHYIQVGIAKRWLGALAGGLLSIIATALSQPNGLFCVYVFAGAYLVHCALGTKPPSRRIGRAVVLCLALVAGWFAMMQLPFFADVIGYRNTGGLTFSAQESIEATLKFELYASQPPQTLLAIISLVGCVAAVRSHRGWLIFPALYMLVGYCVARCTDSYLRTILCGFWYNDPWRLADCAAIFLVPLISMGLATIIGAIAHSIDNLVRTRSNSAKQRGITRKITSIVVTVSLLMFSLYNYFPSYTNLSTGEREKTAFGFMQDRLSREYSTTRDQMYSTKERQFVEKALELIPEGALVVNSPEDGSLFAYAVNNLNTYYRSLAVDTFTEDATIIRERLSEVTTSPEVQNALRNISAHYVILLDQGVAFDEGKWLTQTSENSLKRWDGINLITDDTPGFEVVLADEDMRLYKITGVDD